MKNRKCGSRVSLQEGASIHRMMWCIWCDTVLDSALKMMLIRSSNVKHKKGRYSSSWELHLRSVGRHLPYGITQVYLPPITSVLAPPNPSHAGWYSIYLPWRDGRLSWPSWLDSVLPGSWTSDLSITSPMPNCCTTKTMGDFTFWFSLSLSLSLS